MLGLAGYRFDIIGYCIQFISNNNSAYFCRVVAQLIVVRETFVEAPADPQKMIPTIKHCRFYFVRKNSIQDIAVLIDISLNVLF